MTNEERLDEALKFLLKHNAGSFIYYLDIENDSNKNSKTIVYNNNEDRLIKHFKNINIEEKYHLPIIYNLIGDEYVKAAWNPTTDQDNGQPPTQIMITYKGISFIDKSNGGYSRKRKKEKSKRNLELAQTWAIVIGTILASFWTIYEFFLKLFCH
ncbi:MAG: hypothetical protein A2033_10925 [Bacteroidetes bacterium GWA2_31_9]|nr:MAG: hypothetical protein A2033_10925 [Bacteroidetes bacterium GWA2_31_9]